MTILSKEDYYKEDLEYFLDYENVADCKYQEIINGFDVLALNEKADQFMIYNNAGKVYFITDTTLEQVKDFLTIFY